MTRPEQPECACRGEVGPCPACAEGAVRDEPYSVEAARLAPNPKNVKLHDPVASGAQPPRDTNAETPGGDNGTEAR